MQHYFRPQLPENKPPAIRLRPRQPQPADSLKTEEVINR
jgi:hypothetical protein